MPYTFNIIQFIILKLSIQYKKLWCLFCILLRVTNLLLCVPSFCSSSIVSDISATVGQLNKSCTVRFILNLLFTFTSKCVARREWLEKIIRKNMILKEMLSSVLIVFFFTSRVQPKTKWFEVLKKQLIYCSSPSFFNVEVLATFTLKILARMQENLDWDLTQDPTQCRSCTCL